FGWVSMFSIGYFMVGLMIFLSFFLKETPIRTDYSLFLRAAEGILKTVEPDTVKTERVEGYDKSALFKFARFLGSRWLINNFRVMSEALVLRIAPVKSSLWNLAIFPRIRGSMLTLRRDGIVIATLHEKDQRALRRLCGES